MSTFDGDEFWREVKVVAAEVREWSEERREAARVAIYGTDVPHIPPSDQMYLLALARSQKILARLP